MFKTRLLTIIIVLILLFPSQAALAYNYRGRIKNNPSIRISPFTVTTPINSTVLYKVSVNNIPGNGMHCVKVDLFVPDGYKIYPGAGYTYYHFYAPTTLDFKVKVPNKAGRQFFRARVSWSRDYKCNSIRTSKFSPEVEIIVTK